MRKQESEGQPQSAQAGERGPAAEDAGRGARVGSRGRKQESEGRPQRAQQGALGRDGAARERAALSIPGGVGQEIWVARQTGGRSMGTECKYSRGRMLVKTYTHSTADAKKQFMWVSQGAQHGCMVTGAASWTAGRDPRSASLFGVTARRPPPPPPPPAAAPPCRLFLPHGPPAAAATCSSGSAPGDACPPAKKGSPAATSGRAVASWLALHPQR